MRKIIAKILCLFLSGKVKKLQKQGNSILCIYGHDQQAEPFEKLVKYFLCKGYRFITPEELCKYVSGTEKVNEKLVWLSFDDGWLSNYTDVLPVLKKYNVPATIFVATKGIEDGYYWFTQVFQNLDSTLYENVDVLWHLDNIKRVELIDKLPKYKGQRCTMNTEELKEMTQSGLVSWGNHTHDHVMSDHCTNDELRGEIEKCSKVMMNITGNDCSFIYSYPNGNYDERTVGILKDYGFSMAATTNPGATPIPSDCFKIPRNEFKNGCLEENILQCYALWTPFFDKLKHILGLNTPRL